MEMLQFAECGRGSILGVDSLLYSRLSGVPLRTLALALHFHSKPSRRDFDIAGSSVAWARDTLKAWETICGETLLNSPSFSRRSNKRGLSTSVDAQQIMNKYDASYDIVQ